MDKSHVSFLQVQAGEVRRPGLLAGQRAGALQRIRAVMETPIPLTVMGKLDRRQLRALLEEYPEKLREV